MNKNPNDFVKVRNTVTRKVGKVRRRIADHDVFGKNLEIVDDGAKDFVPLSELVQRAESTVPKLEDVNPEEEDHE